MKATVAPTATALAIVLALTACDATYPEIDDRPDLPVPVVVVPHEEGGLAWGVDATRLDDIHGFHITFENGTGYSDDRAQFRSVACGDGLPGGLAWYAMPTDYLCEDRARGSGTIRVQSYAYGDPIAGRTLERGNGDESLPWDVRWLSDSSPWSEMAVSWTCPTGGG